MHARAAAAANVDDADFDALYPADVAALSERHFTPCAVARRAAKLLVRGPETRVLDIGAGVGKFCLVGALTTPGTFYGIEQRARFVSIARDVAGRLAIPRTHFLHGNLLALEPAEPARFTFARGFDAFYLFNPFAEQLALAADIDDDLDRTPVHFHRYVARTRALLAAAPLGTRVVTYHGFGGEMPSAYRLVLREASGTDVLEMWVKSAEVASRAAVGSAPGSPTNPC